MQAKIPNSLRWFPPRTESLPASTWTVWETTCGVYRIVFVRADSLDMPTHYVPGVRRIIERKDGTTSSVWDGMTYVRDGSCRGYTTLQYAIEAVDTYYLSVYSAIPVHLDQPEHHLTDGTRTSTPRVHREPGKPRENKPKHTPPVAAPMPIADLDFGWEPEVVQ